MLPPKVRQHLETYWIRAKDSLDRGDVPLGAFLAITLIEELGKAILLAGAKISGRPNKKQFYNHGAKYELAVYSNLLVNSRVTRIYGADESRFARWFQKGDLLTIRNSALYLERCGSDLVVPAEAIAREDAVLLVCIAGECLAEAQGTYLGSTPEDHVRLLAQIDKFRTTNR
jgi:AbiV family abortive infection protein